MNYKKAILSNTLYQLGTKFVSTFYILFLSAFITRVLGEKTWGEYATVIGFITFFYVFCEFGLNSIASREFAKKSIVTLNDLVNFLLIRLLNTIVVLFIAYIGLLLLNYPSHIYLAILISFIGLFFYSLGSGCNALFSAKMKYQYLFLSNLVISFINILFLIFLFEEIKNSFYVLFFLLVFSDIAKSILLFLFAIRLTKKSKIVFNKEVASYYIITALPIGVALIFNTLMTQVDKLMLSKMVSTVELGYYALAYKIFDVALVIPTFFMNTAYIAFVKRNNENHNYSLEYSKSFYFLLFLSLLVTFWGFILAPIVIPIIWGIVMVPSINIFLILILGAIIFYLSSPISWTFFVEGKQSLLLYVYLIGFLINFFLNLYAISVFGILGAAITTLLTELYVLVVLEVLRRKYLKVKLLNPFKIGWLKQL